MLEEVEWLENRIKKDARSPLFARLADCYLSQGKFQDALSQCEKGLAYFPSYPTAHLIKGKTLLALNMQAEARRELEFAKEIFPDNVIIVNLLSRISQEVEFAPVKPLEAPKKVGKKPASEPSKGSPSESAVMPEPTISPIQPEPPQPSVDKTFQPQQFDAQQPSSVDTSSPFEFPDVFVTPSQQEEPGISQQPPQPEQAAENPFDFPEIFGTQPTVVSDQQPAQGGESSFGDPFNLILDEKPSIGAQTPELPEPLEIAQPTSDSNLSFETPFSETDQEPIPQTQDEDLFGSFVVRTEFTLSGTENTLTLGSYLGDSDSASSSSSIEEIAQKLENVKRQTPVINLSDRSVRNVAEEESSSSGGFITPTLAEIYVKQGWYDDAIKAYKTLAANRPADRERFEKRIVELEEMKAKTNSFLN